MVNWRYKFCLFLFLFIISSIIVRLFFWQIQKREEFQTKAENQRLFTQAIPAQRGKIQTSDGLPLVLNKTFYLLYANLKEIKDQKKVIAKKIAEVIVEKDYMTEDFTASIFGSQKDKDPYKTRLIEETASLEEKLSLKNLYWIKLSSKISREKKEKIAAYKFSGIGFEEIKDRLYPEASTAAHLLGFVGKDINGKDTGYFGTEGYYNRQLTGHEGEIFGERDVFGIPILIGKFFKKEPHFGHSLILNLDLGVQKIVEKELKLGILQYKAKGGTVIVLNPQNGAVLAMSSFPAYDPSFWQDYKEPVFKNPAIAESYEPGSIFKPLIMAAAINEGRVKPTTKCIKCSGPRSIGGYLIKTFDNQYHPDSTMTEVLENSDNTGMTFVGEKLGVQKLHDYLSKYGFGQLTGIDLQEEAQGNLRSLHDWYEIDKATVSFGQGIAVTSIQMVKALAALANDGQIYQPQIVAKIEPGVGKSVSIKPKMKGRVLKPQTAKVLTEMLVSVCEKSPLHFFRDKIPELKNYRIAAKSGTAQIPIAGHYTEGKTIGSVIGFAPADNPQFLVLVKLTEPQVSPWGANTAGPIFFSIIKELLIYYGISP